MHRCINPRDKSNVDLRTVSPKPSSSTTAANSSHARPKKSTIVQAKCHIERLPLELLDYVFSLASPSNISSDQADFHKSRFTALSSILGVCKAWSDVLRRAVFFRQSKFVALGALYVQAHLEEQERCALVALRLGLWSDNPLDVFLSLASPLRLTRAMQLVRDESSRWRTATIEADLRVCAGDLNLMQGKLKKLRHLSVRHNVAYVHSPADIAQVDLNAFADAPALTSVFIAGDITSNFITLALPEKQLLKIACADTSASVLLTMLDLQPQLHELHWISGPRVQDVELDLEDEYDAVELPQLTKLTLEDVPYIVSSKILHQLRLPALQELILRNVSSQDVSADQLIKLIRDRTTTPDNIAVRYA